MSKPIIAFDIIIGNFKVEMLTMYKIFTYSIQQRLEKIWNTLREDSQSIP